MTQHDERVLTAACSPDLPHAMFRLYVILSSASEASEMHGDYFPVTLRGLLALHPGVGGKPIGTTTLLKQTNELKRHGLIDMSGTLHRNAPHIPVMIRVIPPATERPDVAALIAKIV